MNKEIVQIQMAWFFKSDYIGNFEELSLKIKKELGESKLTQHIPVPTDVPSEIPRLILSYDNFNINFSKNRVDIYFKDFDLSRDAVRKLNKLLIDDFQFGITRLGFIKNFFAEEKIDYLKTLLDQSKISSLDIKEINIRINSLISLLSFECNNIQQIQPGKAQQLGVEKAGILITRDINTLKEKVQEYNFDQAKVLAMFDAFNEESEKLIYE